MSTPAACIGPDARALARLRERARWRRIGFAGTLLLPAAVLLAAVVGYPVLRAIQLSFSHYDLTNPIRGFAGLDNYRSVLSNPVLGAAVTNSLEFVGGSVVLAFVAGLAIALALNGTFRGRAIYRTLLLIPWLISIISFALLWEWILNPTYGVLDDLLLRLGIIHSPEAWLTQTSTAMGLLVIGNAWQQFPFVMVMMLAGLQSVRPELAEAARIDGAGRLQVFRHVTLPAIRNVAVTVTLVLVIWNMQSFALIYILTAGGPVNSTTTSAVFLYDLAFRGFDFGAATAASVLLLIVLLIFTTLYVRLLRDRS